MNIKSWSITDVGKKRDHNEDSILCNNDIQLYLVADGMGGHTAGEMASKTAVESIESRVLENISELTTEENSNSNKTQMLFAAGNNSVINMLQDAVKSASKAILDKVESDKKLQGMGTTAVGLFFYDNQLYYAHVGDSRLYRIRGDEIKQITVDHSLVQEQIDAGIISREEAENSRYKNIITRSVGFEENIDVDCEEIEAKPDDYFLLCSDGLTGLVTDKEIKDIVNQKMPETALQFFVNLANSRGGDDNISVILVKVTG